MDRPWPTKAVGGAVSIACLLLAAEAFQPAPFCRTKSSSAVPYSRGAATARLQPMIARQKQLSSGSRCQSANQVTVRASGGATAASDVAAEVQRGTYLEDMARYNWQTLPEIFETMAVLAPQEPAITDSVHKPTATLTYAELNGNITQMAAALQSKGVGAGDCVSIFSENSHRWLIADQAILRAGGCNAVRGVRAPIAELQYIYSNSESVACVVETPELLKPLLEVGEGLKSVSGAPRFIAVLFSGGKTSKQLQEELGTEVEIVTFDELLAMDGAALTRVPRDSKAAATLVYTSGTTNNPKGVVLSHGNLLHQVFYNTFSRTQPRKYNPSVGDTFVSVLPCWHVFERTAELWMFSKGIHLVYSSVKNFKSDLIRHKPHFLVAVPRLFETIYRGVLAKFNSEKPLKRRLIKFFTKVSMAHVKADRTFRGLVIRDSPPSIIEKLLCGMLLLLLVPLQAAADKLVWSKVRDGLGGRLKVMVAGGSSTPLVLEDFFEMIKATIIVGYGMTETSPVITNRLAEANLRGGVGLPATKTEVKIVDQETGERLPSGRPGIVFMKGPQAMSGYKSNPEATKAVFDEEGFLNTGDLGRLNPGTNDLIITGRAKDTIVLSNGENIEPQPIEDAVCAKSELVDQMMCVGQDKKQLGALVVPNVKVLAQKGFLTRADADTVTQILGGQVLVNGIVGDRAVLKEIEARLNADKRVRKFVASEINRHQGKYIQDFERVGEVQLVLEPFNVANGLLTQTLKVKRNVVSERYEDLIGRLYGSK